MSLTTQVLAALVLGLAAGAAVSAYPAPALLTLVDLIEPIGLLWVNAIRMTVIPLVVSLLITGVVSTADARAVRGLTLRAFAVFVGLILFAALVGLAAVPPAFRWLRVDSMQAGVNSRPEPAAVPGFADWVTGLVPANPIAAAAEGAILPLVVFTLIFAVALLALTPERRDPVVALFRGVGDAMMVIVRAVIALSPIGVFALLLPLALRTGTALAGALGYYVVVMSGMNLLVALLLYPIAAAAGGVRISRFAHGVLPAQAVAFSSSSSLASLPALVEGANRRLGLPARTADIVLPLAVSVFKIGLPVMWLVAATFLARVYGVTLTPAQMVLIALTALLTSFSTPGVPHGWLLVITPLVTPMGIPPEGVALLIAVDAIVDRFATLLNVTGDMAAAAVVSRQASLPMADEASPALTS